MFKKLFLLLIFMTVFAYQAHAVVYVWTDKATDEVIFLDEKDSVIISSGDQSKIKKTMLQKDIEFYGLTEAYTDYKFVNGKFILNTKKISDKVNAQEQQDADDVMTRVLIDLAKSKLVALGLSIDEANALHP